MAQVSCAIDWTLFSAASSSQFALFAALSPTIARGLGPAPTFADTLPRGPEELSTDVDAYVGKGWLCSFSPRRTSPAHDGVRSRYDSLMAVERRIAAGRAWVSLPTTLAFEQPTIQALADHLFRRVGPDRERCARFSSDSGDVALESASPRTSRRR